MKQVSIKVCVESQWINVENFSLSWKDSKYSLNTMKLFSMPKWFLFYKLIQYINNILIEFQVDAMGISEMQIYMQGSFNIVTILYNVVSLLSWAINLSIIDCQQEFF